ncbi:FitA-like ribbon-helix-helix domain-containing protein [Actinomycetospora cinnamomea]|uniref:FitA-like ribbon-helix-helix domain-containing protein n=1 Tax=Actinomycetospora cinnamomea TaxID=663609 RepID=UPI003C2FA9F8
MHDACVSTSITVRDVPEEVRDELAARAARTGRSLQEHLRRELIEMARRPSPDALWARVRARRRRRAPGSARTTSSPIAMPTVRDRRRRRLRGGRRPGR